jgi:3-hydroxybutyryl-CoA dehydrogenase
MPSSIICLGAGRMGRGIAVCFAYAGQDVILLDAKPRDTAAFAKLAEEAEAELRGTFASLARCGLFDAADIDAILARISIKPESDTAAALAASHLLFEGVPEVADLKRDLLARVSAIAPADMIIASTTSTILVDDLSPAIVGPERFLNAHWLNPAYIIPLVEVSPGVATSPDVTARLIEILEAIGKVPVVCKPSPGFIVPRLQSLAMNEAARLVAENVASPADIDKAVRYGFGFRFGVLGVLEFIDWGGGDILYYGSRYLSQALDAPRFDPPDNVIQNMHEGRLGLKSGQGFFEYPADEVEAYKHGRLQALVNRLKDEGLAKSPIIKKAVLF